jgi:hypothetical protein
MSWPHSMILAGELVILLFAVDPGVNLETQPVALDKVNCTQPITQKRAESRWELELLDA